MNLENPSLGYDRPAYASAKPGSEEIAAGPLTSTEQIYRAYGLAYPDAKPARLSEMTELALRSIGQSARRAMNRSKFKPGRTLKDVFNTSYARHVSAQLGADRTVPRAIAKGDKSAADLYDQTGALTADGRIAAGYTMLQASLKRWRETDLEEATLKSLNQNRVDNVELAYEMATAEDIIRGDIPNAIKEIGSFAVGKDYEKEVNVIKYRTGSLAVKVGENAAQNWQK